MRIVASLNDLAGGTQPLQLPDSVPVGGAVEKIARHAPPRRAFGPAEICRRRRQNVPLRSPLQFARHGVERARQASLPIAAAGAIAQARFARAIPPQPEGVAVTPVVAAPSPPRSGPHSARSSAWVWLCPRCPPWRLRSARAPSPARRGEVKAIPFSRRVFASELSNPPFPIPAPNECGALSVLPFHH